MEAASFKKKRKLEGENGYTIQRARSEFKTAQIKLQEAQSEENIARTKREAAEANEKTAQMQYEKAVRMYFSADYDDSFLVFLYEMDSPVVFHPRNEDEALKKWNQVERKHREGTVEFGFVVATLEDWYKFYQEGFKEARARSWQGLTKDENQELQDVSEQCDETKVLVYLYPKDRPVIFLPHLYGEVTKAWWAIDDTEREGTLEVAHVVATRNELSNFCKYGYDQAIAWNEQCA